MTTPARIQRATRRPNQPATRRPTGPTGPTGPTNQRDPRPDEPNRAADERTNRGPDTSSQRWPRRLKAAVIGGSAVALLSGCVKNAPQDTLKAHGSIARLQNSLLFPVFWIAVFVFCIVGGLVGYCVIRFRARSDDEAPRQIHGHTKAEIAWTIAPAVLLASIAIPTVKFVFDLNVFPKNTMTINVTGHRWWWQMDYNKGSDANALDFSTATEMHIPVKEKVVVTLTSVDVIHNFWVPELAGKLYAIPGRTNKLVIEADTPGTYYGQCAEYCGTSHSNMRLRVIAQTPADYASWVQSQEAPAVQPPGTSSTTGSTDTSSTTSTTAAPTGGTSTSTTDTSLVATGFNVFKTAGCSGCHTITGISEGVVGPNLTHFKSRSVFAGAIFANTDNNLRLWLANPPGEKPGSVMPNLGLSADQINQLIAYLDTLR
jgi:cytochrome c oxidase subunit 2